ncbi:LOW QUALITY PROTEIN: von Willebrand factor A domain-containing protein 5A-like [Apus apus]|uniref:LOW QUALITY PROTEIN: von Willebrand factor A domain-containing protein 5A-like n=1 Tax=Apus apus TaxID=8895 RepID=UPI0021F911AF|nr:LOW QUALITY PROTEIN: von Willebrand factor A domain-containing protein 5A-like [Apus apus]
MWSQSFGLLRKSYIHDAGSFLLGKSLHVPLSSVPLCSAVVDVAIQDYVADVASELIYQNKGPTSTEILFVFPLGPHMAIYSFQACSEDAKVEAVLRDEAQQLHKATGDWENLGYLQDQSMYPGEVFVCSLGTLSPGREVVVTLRFAQELSREPDGAARFVLPPTLHPHTKHYAWNCGTSKLPYSLLLTTSFQSPRGVTNVQANFSLTPLIYTAQDHSSAQVSLAGTPPDRHDLELLVYYGDPTAVSVMIERGDPGAPPGSLLGDPMVLVTVAPSIPEAVPGQPQSGELIFLLDTTFLEHASDSLLFLLKSLPLGCYFNIYCYGETTVGIFPQSVEYTQDNVTKAMRCIPSTGSNLGDSNLLGTLRSVYNTPQPRGHTRQLFIFMAGLSPDQEAIAAEVCRHRNSHRCFSFFFSEDSAALATALAKETGGEATYVSSDNSLTAVVLKYLKRALKPAAEGVSLSWTLPYGLEIEVLGETPQSIFQGQHSLLYAQIHGPAQDTTAAKGVLTLQYSLDGQEVTHTVEFPLHPQGDGRLAGHRMAMRCLLKRLVLETASGFGDEPRHRAVEISLTSGIICPFTSYVGVCTSQRVSWYQVSWGRPHHHQVLLSHVLNSAPVPVCLEGPLALLPPHQTLIPCQTIELPGSLEHSCCSAKSIWIPPGWLRAVCASWAALRRLTSGIAALPKQEACSKAHKPLPSSISCLKYVDSMDFHLGSPIFGSWTTKAIAECQELVALQNVDGSWALSSGLALVLEVDEAEIKGKMPGEATEPSIWGTVLAVTWLHRDNKCYQDLCELLEAKAVTWLCNQAVSQLDKCLEAANMLLGSSVKPDVFRL